MVGEKRIEIILVRVVGSGGAKGEGGGISSFCLHPFSRTAATITTCNNCGGALFVILCTGCTPPAQGHARTNRLARGNPLDGLQSKVITRGQSDNLFASDCARKLSNNLRLFVWCRPSLRSSSSASAASSDAHQREPLRPAMRLRAAHFRLLLTLEKGER